MEGYIKLESVFRTILVTKVSDNLFLKIICRMIDPYVRTSKGDIKQIVDVFNKHLNCVGYELIQVNEDGNRPEYEAKNIKTQAEINPKTDKLMNRHDIKENLDECKEKFTLKEYAYVIIKCRIILEAAMEDIYYQKTGNQLVINKNSNLNSNFNKIIKLLPKKEPFNNIGKKFTTIVNNSCEIRNDETHSRKNHIPAEEYEANLILNSTITIIDYLYMLLLNSKTV